MKHLILVGAAMLALAATARAEDMRVGGTGASAALSEQLAAAYGKHAPQDAIEVVFGLGSSGGIAAAAEGAIQVAFSGRELKPAEAARGLRATPFLDTPFVFVTSHPKRQSIAREDVAAIYDGHMRNWSDGREIKPVLRPRGDSMTPWLATHLPGVGQAMEVLRARPEVPVAATDHDNIQLAEAVPGSLAPATLVQYLAERPRLRLVAFGGVDPSLATLEDGRWRDVVRLWIVAPEKPTPGAQRFLTWLDSPEAIAILRENGARPAPKTGTAKTN